MKRYVKYHTVVCEDLDELNHVNNVKYIDWFQSIAKDHGNKKAQKDIIDQYYWVLIDHHIQYKKPAFLNDNLKIETFVTGISGVTSERIVEIHNTDKTQLIVLSKTTWCLMDRNSHKPKRMSHDIAQIFD